MDFAVSRFALAAVVGGFWLPGHVHSELTITHNVTIGSGGGYALPEEGVTIQCSVKQKLATTRLFISIPLVTNCMGCRESGYDGDPICNSRVIREDCFVDTNGYLNATLIVFDGPNKLGLYHCDYLGEETASLEIALRVPAENIEVALLSNDTSNIEQNENRTLDCKTSCDVVPDPQYEWPEHSSYDSITDVTLPCTNVPTKSVAGSQLTIVWQQTDHSSNSITYKCCETDGHMCDDITIAHATVSASNVFSPDDGPMELYPGESMIINCTTDCPLAPLPELVWLNENGSWSENVPCGDDGRYLSVVSHLKVNWNGTATGEGINIDYICCASDSLLCTTISVSHNHKSPETSTFHNPTATADDSSAAQLPDPSGLSTGEKVGIGLGCATILALAILIPVCCCCEDCPCYTCCHNPKPDSPIPQTTEPHYNEDRSPIQMSENSYSQKVDN